MGRSLGLFPSSSSSSLMLGRIVLLAINDVSFFLLGGSAWILVNGIYAQIPFIIAFFDGDYGVVSKITLSITLSSLLPILGSILFFGFLLPATSSIKGRDSTGTNSSSSSSSSNSDSLFITTDNHVFFIDCGIALILSLGFTTSLVLTLWTEWITSQLIPLLVATVAGGIVGTTSSILYYPHAATAADAASADGSSSADSTYTATNTHTSTNTTTNTAKRQTTAMLFGTAASNLFVAVLAIIQQHHHQQQQQLETREAKTNIMRTYFGIITIFMGLAIAGFSGTLVVRRIGNITLNYVNDSNEEDHSYSELSSLVKIKGPRYMEPSSSSNSSLCILKSQSQSQLSQKTNNNSLSFWGTSCQHSSLNTAQFILNTLTFFLPGIVPYSVRGDNDDENDNASALRYLIVSQLVAQTLGVLASSTGGSSSCRRRFYYGNTKESDNNKDGTVKFQLGCFFLFLWIPVVFLSFKDGATYGIGIPIAWNAVLNFVYGYCNTAWFHLLVNHQHLHRHPDDADGVTMMKETAHNIDVDRASTTSAVRVMGTWHQIGATVGSAIAFGLVQTAAI